MTTRRQPARLADSGWYAVLSLSRLTPSWKRPYLLCCHLPTSSEALKLTPDESTNGLTVAMAFTNLNDANGEPSPDKPIR